MAVRPSMFPREFASEPPGMVAVRVLNAGVAKAEMPARDTLLLSVLAGVFIAFGAMFFTLAITESGLGLGPERVLGGVAFSLGLILVAIAGGELFTGNNLIAIAWASRRVGAGAMLRNWAIVYAGNLAGSLAAALLAWGAGLFDLGGGALGETARSIASGKVALAPHEALLRGFLCNILVCLAVWLAMSAPTVSGKVLGIVFPICAFVALGFEHCVANMYLISAGWLAGAEQVTAAGFAANLLYVTAGNLFGGVAAVGMIYWRLYLSRE